MEIEDVIKNKDDKEFVLKAVQEKGKLLEFASERLQNDKEVVIEALKQDGEAAEFISDELKDDKEIMMLAIKGMLPKNSLGRQMLKKVRVYAGNEHENIAQKPEVWNF